MLPSRAVVSKPSGGIRSLPSLSAWGLPTPVVALAGIGNVIFRCFLVQAGDFYFYGVCKFVFLGSPLGHPKGVPCAELSPQVTEGLPATTANRFHKELRFFFSLLKRKKRSKKRKEFALHLYYITNASHEDYTENFPLMQNLLYLCGNPSTA